MKKHEFIYNSEVNEERIYYVFQRLITPIIISKTYIPYKKYWKEFNELYMIVEKWISMYFNNKTLIGLKKEDLEKFDEIITYLMLNCFQINSKYVEEIDIWHMEFMQMVNDFIEEGRIKRCEKNQK